MIVRSAALGDRPSIAIRLHQAITLQIGRASCRERV